MVYACGGQQQCLPQSSLIFKRRSHTEPGAHYYGQPTWQRVPRICLSPCATVEFSQVWHHAWLKQSTEDLSSGPHGCIVNVLPTEPPPKPQELLWGRIRIVLVKSCYTSIHFIKLVITELNVGITFWKRTKIGRFWDSVLSPLFVRNSSTKGSQPCKIRFVRYISRILMYSGHSLRTYTSYIRNICDLWNTEGSS